MVFDRNPHPEHSGGFIFSHPFYQVCALVGVCLLESIYCQAFRRGGIIDIFNFEDNIKEGIPSQNQKFRRFQWQTDHKFASSHLKGRATDNEYSGEVVLLISICGKSQ